MVHDLGRYTSTSEKKCKVLPNLHALEGEGHAGGVEPLVGLQVDDLLDARVGARRL